MSLSGSNTGALRPYTARNALELALRRAGIPPAKWTSEILDIAYDEFNVMLDEMLNLGMQLWGRDRIILPIYQNQNQVTCPLGTSLVISTNQRSMMRPDVINPFSTQGGTAANAFDDDFDTSCTQTAINGSIGAYYSTATQITTVGILFDAASAGEFGLFYEYTMDDGATWVSADAADITVAAGAQEWFWRDITGTPAATGWRVRAVSDVILSVAEIYFGNNPTEIPMGVWSLDDWNAMPSKDTPGPPWNWYQQRDLDTPVLYVWPRPNDQAKYYQLICWRRRYLDQITDMTQTMDVSRRWYEAITATMARRLCRSLPESDMARYPMLVQEETTAFQLAAGEERDPAPMRYNPGLGVYRA
jgi:hypothetical protein